MGNRSELINPLRLSRQWGPLQFRYTARYSPLAPHGGVHITSYYPLPDFFIVVQTVEVVLFGKVAR